MITRNGNSPLTYSQKFNIDAEEYVDVSIKTLPFSNRVINSLMRNKIYTFDMLLNLSPETLMQIKGFGKGCIDEINHYFSTLSDNNISTKDNSSLSDIHSLIKMHKDEIINGDFSAFVYEDLTEDEITYLERYKDAFETLGKDMVFDCVENPKKIFPIIYMLSNYQEQMKRLNEMWKFVYNIPKTRCANYVVSYINAYTIDEVKRKLLYSVCNTENSTLLDFVNSVDLSDDIIFLESKRFLKWCSFNLRAEIETLFESLYAKNTHRTVILMRAQKHTLEEIGSTLGVTRERIRQIEAKVKRKFNHFQNKIRIISKISADRNGDSIITPIEITEYCGINSEELVYLLQSCESSNYTYDRQLEIFIVGSDSIKERVDNYIENLPDIIKASNLSEILQIAENDADIPAEMLEKAIVDSYRFTGEVYHRCQLSLATVYKNILEKYYPYGFKAYDSEEIAIFRKLAVKEYGNIRLPEHDRALTARIASICILCGRGVYKLKDKEFISKKLANKIYNYINKSDCSIFLTNSIFAVFEKELLAEGIDNKYFLQGILRDLFGDKYFFKRDYITKDFNVTSVYSEVVSFIKKSDYPVSKQEIQKAFPGITEIVINFAIDDPNVLNYFGEYLHTSKLKISDSEKVYLHNTLKRFVADNSVHHGQDIYKIISKEKPEILTRNAVMYPFGAYSILEHLFRDEFQFVRPYIAKNGTEIIRNAEKIHDFVYSKDEIAISELSDFARENYFQIQSLLDYINGCNDEFLLVNDDCMMKIDKTGINKNIGEAVDNVIASKITDTEIISNLDIWSELPSINIPWTDWLIYSVIVKWGKKTTAGTSSNQFKLSVPLVAPQDNFNSDKFSGVEKSHSTVYFKTDNLDDIDSLLEDLIDESFLTEI